MLEALNQRVDDVASLNSKLIIVIGPPRSGKTRLLNALAKQRQVGAVNVGAALGHMLLEIPGTRRHVEVGDLFKDVAAAHAADGLVLLDNIELLFDRSLRLNPLDLLKRQAHVRRVVAVWPGEINGSRLIYAARGHPEYQDHGVEGLVPFEIN
ncbi:BREX-3 system P-loop-containing protein BrxF [Mesorhizobium sp. BR115XR7A]|uniref:BREX-3 system P-loop-containing protein BrxF n=1 Tax=Mesorhizobium sp. BR115XR7A TaxID=2876645 RepID=UPI001CD0032E|nr:BREX-3 system P-loop-containing protein BrxF [Mesorhizobium sp. BR115XR7A]MBZ9908075.1 BREX-3 system P-loop-containing protein BrxF [Mesorhizobium sp. BR115XR7A]MBZ9931381.1 BREX-3 system P-loop-containing protein BrxF [Mesorhizobium sp. BR1-1-5]